MRIWVKLHRSAGDSKETTLDITNDVTKVQWSGADTQATRSLTVTLVNDPWGEHGKAQARNGDKISFWVKDDNGLKKRLFWGRVVSQTKTGEVGTVDINCQDYMKTLTESKVNIKYKGKTAEYIARDCCRRAGVAVGKVSKTKRKIDRLYATNTSFYNIIMKAYAKAEKKSHVPYIAYMDGSKFCVKHKGAVVGDKVSDGKVEHTFTLTSDTDLTKFEIKYDASSVVNKVLVYDSKGRKIGTVSDAASIKKYGLRQNVVTAKVSALPTGSSSGKTMSSKKKQTAKQKAAARKKKLEREKKLKQRQDKVKKKNAKSKADAKKKAKLGITKRKVDISLEALGDIRCVSGAGIRIQDKSSGITAQWWIMSDSHTWENGQYMMSLTLRLKNQQEVPEVEYQKPTSSSTSNTSGSSGGRVLNGRKVPAVFTAYDKQTCGSTGHFGKCIPYKTCSGPWTKRINLAHKYIQIVDGCGSKWNGRTLHVTDNGSAIDADGNRGIIHIDVYTVTHAEAKRFGRKTGHIIIGNGTGYHHSSGSGSTKFNGKLKKPISAPKTGHFGYRGWGEFSNFHYGNDYGATIGSAVKAAGAGVVTHASRYSGYGNCICIRHTSHLYTLYGHLMNGGIHCHVGQHVKQGQYIGQVGKTGSVKVWGKDNGCLHFGVYLANPTSGERYARNPDKYL